MNKCKQSNFKFDRKLPGCFNQIGKIQHSRRAAVAKRRKLEKTLKAQRSVTRRPIRPKMHIWSHTNVPNRKMDTLEWCFFLVAQSNTHTQSLLIFFDQFRIFLVFSIEKKNFQFHEIFVIFCRNLHYILSLLKLLLRVDAP
jgi:hypothetical protein